MQIELKINAEPVDIMKAFPEIVRYAHLPFIIKKSEDGVLKLEGKEYVVQDGEIVHIRHSG